MSTFLAILAVAGFVRLVFLCAPRPPRRPPAPLRRVEPQFPMPPTAIQVAYAAFELGNHPPVQETVIPSPGAEFLDPNWEWKFEALPGEARYLKVRCRHLEYVPVKNDGNLVSLLCTTCGDRIRVES